MRPPGVVGIDLGGTNCRGGVVRADGEVAAELRMETGGEEQEPERFIRRLSDFCREIMESAGQDAIAAVGVGAAGAVDLEGKVRQSPNLPFLDGQPLAEMLSGALDRPVRVVNDANAIAWGEATEGAGTNLRSFLALTLGTGVGGGLILDGRLWEGVDGTAGEVGHLLVEPDGRSCGCGNRGCLERYASATGIRLTVEALLREGRRSTLQTRDGSGLETPRIAAAAREGDAVARDAFREAGRRLGQVLAGVANLLNLEGVVIAGGAAESLDLMLPDLRDELRRRAFAIPAARLEIRRGRLGDRAGIIGAARLAQATQSRA